MSPASVVPKFHTLPRLLLAILLIALTIFGANSQSTPTSQSCESFYASLNQAQNDQLVAIVNLYNVTEPQFHQLFNDFASGLSAALQVDAANLYPNLTVVKFNQLTFGYLQFSEFSTLSASQLAEMASCKIEAVDLTMSVIHNQTLAYQTFDIEQGWIHTLNNYAELFLNGVADGSINATSLTVGEKIALNRRMMRSSIDNMMLYGPLIMTVDQEIGNGVNESKWLYRASFNGTGNYTMLVIGNSHADQITNEIAKAFKDNYSQLNFFTIQGCLPFNVNYTPPRYNDAECQKYHAAVLDLVRDTKPDIVFANFYWDTMGQPPISYPIKHDDILKDIAKPLHVIAKHTKLIYFSAPGLNYNFTTALVLAERLWLGQSLENLNLPLTQQMAFSDVHYQRLAALKCKKCIIVDWTKVFCDKATGVCKAYDPVNQLAYLYDTIHYSYWGAQLALPYLEELAANLTQTGLHPHY